MRELFMNIKKVKRFMVLCYAQAQQVNPKSKPKTNKLATLHISKSEARKRKRKPCQERSKRNKQVQKYRS